MPTLTDLQRQARYDAWANRTLAAVLRDAHERPIRLLAHAAESELVWLRRIEGTQPASTTADFWPVLDADGCPVRLVGASPGRPKCPLNK